MGARAVVRRRGRSSLTFLPALLRSSRFPFLPVLVTLMAGLPAGCTRSVAGFPETPGPVTLSLEGRDGLASGVDGPAVLRYLGVGGWLVRWRGAALMTAPFYSNPGFLRVGLWTISADTARIDRRLPDVRDVSAILVGHSHYDHLMDVPWVARRRAPRAVLYGSETMVHTLAGFTSLKEEGRLVAVDREAGDDRTPGAWTEVAGGRIRFMALRSSHAPHFLGQAFYAGRRTEDIDWEPGLAPEWLEGRTLAFLIDLRDERGETVFRIYYQDAASQAPAGFLPPLPPRDRHRVDVAILCPASFDQVDRYPEAILENVRPRHVLLGHWEDFFRDPARSLRTVPFTDLQEFIDRLIPALPRDASWTLPEPGAEIRMGRDGV